MNHIIAIALGGACGSILRFLVSSAVAQWLGRTFPYGTLTVNIIGCFLMGLLAETLVLQRIAMTMEFRAAILVGVMGGFTTFSSFSLETLFLLEQGSFAKASTNVFVSIVVCLFATWIGLWIGRALFHYAEGMVQWESGMFPYAMVAINAVIALLIGVVAAFLLQRVAISPEYRAIFIVLMIGIYLTLSGLYLSLFMIEHGFSFADHFNLMLSVFISNSLISILVLWSGLLIGKQL